MLRWRRAINNHYRHTSIKISSVSERPGGRRHVGLLPAIMVCIFWGWWYIHFWSYKQELWILISRYFFFFIYIYIKTTTTTKTKTLRVYWFIPLVKIKIISNFILVFSGGWPKHCVGFIQVTTPFSCFIQIQFCWSFHLIRANCGLAPSQWEMSLQSNAVSHWLDANLESALFHVQNEELKQMDAKISCVSESKLLHSVANPYYTWHCF